MCVYVCMCVWVIVCMCVGVCVYVCNKGSIHEQHCIEIYITFVIINLTKRHKHPNSQMFVDGI